jgi:hypothetical protein
LTKNRPAAAIRYFKKFAGLPWQREKAGPAELVARIAKGRRNFAVRASVLPFRRAAGFGNGDIAGEVTILANLLRVASNPRAAAHVMSSRGAADKLGLHRVVRCHLMTRHKLAGLRLFASGT